MFQFNDQAFLCIQFDDTFLYSKTKNLFILKLIIFAFFTSKYQQNYKNVKNRSNGKSMRLSWNFYLFNL